jgi:hypothetical protein
MQARGGQYIANLRELTAPGQSVRGKVAMATSTDEATGSSSAAPKLRLDFVSFVDSSNSIEDSSSSDDVDTDIDDSA